MSNGSRVDVRLGAELLSKVEAFKQENGMQTGSQAVRALIELGLGQSTQLDVAWRRLAWREGTITAQARFKAAIAEAIDRVTREAP